MTRWIRLMLGVALGIAAFGANAQTCSQTLNSGADLQAAMNAAPHNAGFVICLNAGTYNGTTNGGVVFPANGGFAVGKNIIVRGAPGTSPGQVILQSTFAGVDHTVYFVNFYGGGTTANSAQLIGLTIQGGGGGVQIYNFLDAGATRLTDIKLKDVVITTNNGANGFGVLTRKADRIVLDNVTVGSHLTALNIIDTTDSLVMNSLVTATAAEAAAALAVIGGSGNRFVNNTLGNSPRNSAADPYSFNGGGVVFYNTSSNRFEGNIVQGMRDDAVDFTITDLTVNGIPLQKSLNNYVGKNQVIHSDFNLHGETAGSSGIWTNCASDGSWLFGNEIRNTAECGVCVWGSKSNMVLGNNIHNNGIAGLFVSGGQEALNECQPAGNLTFRQKPVNNYLQNNATFFNRNDEIVIRNADSTIVSRNFASSNNGLNGPAQGCISSACQAAFSIEADGSMFGSNSGTQILANTTLNTLRGLWTQPDTGSAVTGIGFYLNRIINTTNNRWVTGSAQGLDRGAILGGNKWSQHIPTGNPSSGQPFTGVFHNVGNQTGNVVDNHPYQSEDLGRGYNITVSEPRASSSVARGTRRTVRWDSIGCFWVDLTLGGTPLATSTPNTGYAIVDIPVGAALGNTSIVATCKDKNGNARSTANSPTFAITSETLKLVSPGRDDTFNGGQQIWVSWRNSNPAVNTTVFVEYSTDGGATFPTLLATINNQNTSNAHVSSTRVTLPATATAYGKMRVRSAASVVDSTDGVFAVRGGTGALANVSAGRVFRMGQPERLEWSSRPDSRLVDISATSGNTITVATNLPDRGFFDWIVPAFSSATTLSITVTFKNDAGGVLGSVTNAASGVTRNPTTITFGNPPGIGPGQSGTLTATANSGAGVTLTSSTPGVCTVSGGNTINGVANGTCTITGNAAATGTYAAALPSQLSFTLGQSQTITFNAPDYLVVGSSIGLSATASSGLPVSFSSLTPSICSVSGGNVLTGNAVGTCTVAANQPGSGGFGAAPQVTDNLQAVAGANLPRLVNISTRMQVLTGDNVLIGGFVLGGGTPKNIVVRARGPSLTAAGVPGALPNPVLQMFQGPTLIDSNDNWQSHPNQAALAARGFAPPDPLDAAIYTTIGPGPFSAIVSGVGGVTGVGIIEVFEVDAPEKRLINISTRGQVLTGADVMIAGFIIQGQAPQTVVVRARGPSLAAQGVAGVLANPRLQLFTGPTEIGNNDNWQSASNATAIQQSGFAPLDPAEPAVMVTLAPGAYTAIISGVGNTTGVAIVEVFGLE